MGMTIIFCILLLATLAAWQGAARLALIFYIIALISALVSFLNAMDSTVRISL